MFALDDSVALLPLILMSERLSTRLGNTLSLFLFSAAEVICIYGGFYIKYPRNCVKGLETVLIVKRRINSFPSWGNFKLRQTSLQAIKVCKLHYKIMFSNRCIWIYKQSNGFNCYFWYFIFPRTILLCLLARLLS